MSADDGAGTFGISHLSDHPIALSYGGLLVVVLLLLLLFRVLFGSITVSGGAR